MKESDVLEAIKNTFPDVVVADNDRFTPTNGLKSDWKMMTARLPHCEINAKIKKSGELQVLFLVNCNADRVIVRSVHFNGAPQKTVSLRRRYCKDTQEFYTPKKQPRYTGAPWTNQKDYEHYCYNDKEIDSFSKTGYSVYTNILSAIKSNIASDADRVYKKVKNDDAYIAQRDAEVAKLKMTMKLKLSQLLNGLNEELAEHAPSVYEYGYRFMIANTDFINDVSLKSDDEFKEYSNTINLSRKLDDGTYSSSESNLQPVVRFIHTNDKKIEMKWTRMLSDDLGKYTQATISTPAVRYTVMNKNHWVKRTFTMPGLSHDYSWNRAFVEKPENEEKLDDIRIQLLKFSEISFISAKEEAEKLKEMYTKIYETVHC